MQFAFSDQQFAEGMKKLGLGVGDEDKVVSIGAGGFILKSDVKAYKEMGQKQKSEMQACNRWR
ncbi:hypothetical protein QTG56_24610 (plasmid) [Rossellomorea sp. AcN35-11]|nr:hypothetical protein QTG56_24610 [Rossellomorea sp. AcN35-11]